ncbi:MAG: AAA family ATPase [Candidatus Lokiarchaeota archaeon]|nr:AAA family ATPase [Candidatus Lokiarchaeota archaeon]
MTLCEDNDLTSYDLGPATTKRLIEAGYTAKSLLLETHEAISKKTGLGLRSIRIILKKINLSLTKISTADVIWEQRRKRPRLSINRCIDDILGGIETGGITEFFGKSGTGKTQICHQLCVNVQKPQSKGGLGGNVLYIDAEGTFRPERLVEIAEQESKTECKTKHEIESMLQTVYVLKAYNSDMLSDSIQKLHTTIKEKGIKIKLIIIDSVSSFFFEFERYEEQQDYIINLLNPLKKLFEIYHDLAVVITNQVTENKRIFFGDPVVALGSHALAHGVTTRVYLRNYSMDTSNKFIAKLISSPNLPVSEAVYYIDKSGIADKCLPVCKKVEDDTFSDVKRFLNEMKNGSHADSKFNNEIYS